MTTDFVPQNVTTVSLSQRQTGDTIEPTLLQRFVAIFAELPGEPLPEDALSEKIRQLLPRYLRHNREALDFAGKFFDGLPDVEASAPSASLKTTSTASNRSSTGKPWLDVDFKTAVHVEKDHGPTPATLRILPLDARIKAGPTQGLKVGGEACLMDLSVELYGGVATAEAFCLAGNAGITIAGMEKATDGVWSKLPHIGSGSKASLVEFAVSQEVARDEKCSYDLTLRAGVGTAGSEIKLSPTEVKVYQGFGPVGLGVELVKECDK